MEKQELSPEDSLTIISRAIENLKMNFKEYAMYFLLWGWMLTFASFSNFFLLRMLHAREAYELMGPLSLGNWGVFILTGFIIQLFMDRKIKRNKKVYSHLEGYIRNIWMVGCCYRIFRWNICLFSIKHSSSADRVANCRCGHNNIRRDDQV
jgi:hypothetical protein